MPTFVHTLPRSRFLFIGDISVRFEHYDVAEASVMLVIGDPSKPRLRSLRSTDLKVHESTTLPNGAVVQLEAGATQKRAILRITTTLPIRTHEEVMAERELASRPDSTTLH